MAAPAYLANNDASLARLIKDGAIFIRPVGQGTVPTGTDWTPGPTDGQIGFYSEDGFTLTPAPGDTTDINGHNGDPVVSEQMPGWWTLGFSGLEHKDSITAAYFDISPEDIGEDGSVTVNSAANSKRYDVVTVGYDQQDRLIVVHYPNVQISEKEGLTFNRSTLLAYGMTFRSFRGGQSTPYHFKAWGLLADAPADESSSSSSSSSGV